jgi:hypothetical protein
MSSIASVFKNNDLKVHFARQVMVSGKDIKNKGKYDRERTVQPERTRP